MNKKLVLTLAIEAIVVAVIILILASVFKIIPTGNLASTISPSQFPISPNASDVNSAMVIYSVTGEVKSLTSTGDTYSLILTNYPTQTFLYKKDAVVKQVTVSGFTKIQDVKPGDKVIMSANYNPKTKTWMVMPAVPQNITLPNK